MIIFAKKKQKGKSTILNGLIGKVHFKAGFKIGKGLTSKLQLYKHTDGIYYGDTPGLSDIEMRKQAAEEITKALKRTGIFKIFFIVTVEAGRVRSDDVTTINTVLKSINHPIQYGVIVNKVSEVFINTVAENKNNEKEKIFSGFNSGKNRTNHFFYFECQEELEDQDNVLCQLPTELNKFIYSVVPPTIIEEKNVQAIQLDDFEKMKKEFDKQIDRLYKNKEESKRFYEKVIFEQNQISQQMILQLNEQIKKRMEEQNSLLEQIEQERKDSFLRVEKQYKLFEEQLSLSKQNQLNAIHQQKEHFEFREKMAAESRNQEFQILKRQIEILQKTQIEVQNKPKEYEICIIF